MTQNSIRNSASIMDVDNIRLNGNTISSTDTNGNVVLAPDGNGVVSITTAPIVPTGDRADSLGSATNSWDNVYCDGITFDDGSSILGTYGALTSWTPSYTFGGGSTGIVYGSQTGFYRQIGQLFYFYFSIVLTNKGSSSGTILVNGFPFTHNRQTVYKPYYKNVTFSKTQLSCKANNGLASFSFGIRGSNVGSANLQSSGFANDTEMTVSGVTFL